MATSAAGVIKAPQSAPDLQKLAAMTDRVVQVTRHLSKNGAGSLVLPAWAGVSVEQITALQTDLPGKHGAGTYAFEVYDKGGPEKDAWTVKLGPEVSEAPPMPSVAAGNGAGYGFSNMPGVETPPSGPRQLGQYSSRGSA